MQIKLILATLLFFLYGANCLFASEARNDTAHSMEAALRSVVAIHTLIVKDDKYYQQIKGDTQKTKTYFGNIPKLKALFHLDLSGCDIKSLPDTIFTNLSIRSLDLSNNRHLDLPGLCRQLATDPRIIYLNVERDSITSFPDELKNCTALQAIHADHNYFSRLPDSISNLKNLKWLFAGYNKFLDVDRLFRDLEPVTGLRVLFIEHLGIPSLPPSFCRLKSLEMLYIRGNPLTRLPDCITEMPRLNHIEASGKAVIYFIRIKRPDITAVQGK